MTDIREQMVLNLILESGAHELAVPHTETSNANVSGTYNTYGTSGADYGNFNGTVQVTRTYYQAQTNQWPFVDVVLTVYSRSGTKVYETWHQGNFRWSKPDKDCLDDAFKYLIGLNPGDAVLGTDKRRCETMAGANIAIQPNTG